MPDKPKRMYDLIDTTADIGVKAYGKDLCELFESCALAMFDIISDTKKIDGKGEMEIKLAVDELDQLLVDFLNNLLYFKDTDNFVFASCKVKKISKKNGKWLLDATMSGEVFQKGKHVVGKDVKAATYHRLEINEKEGYATVIFDI